MTARTCLDCPSPIGPKSTGRCQTCANRRLNNDPEIRARRRASVMKAFEDPVVRERQREGARRSKKDKMARDPAYAARLQEQGRALRLHPSNISAEARAEAGRKISARALAWCPLEYRALNDQLRAKGFRLAERKAAILAEVVGTPEHAQRQLANATLAMRLKHERNQAQAY